MGEHARMDEEWVYTLAIGGNEIKFGEGVGHGGHYRQEEDHDDHEDGDGVREAWSEAGGRQSDGYCRQDREGCGDE